MTDSDTRLSADIVERLEHYAKVVMPHYPNDLCSEAKREIERLRQELNFAFNRIADKDVILSRAPAQGTREQELLLEIESLKGAMQVLSEGYDRIKAERDAALAAQPAAAPAYKCGAGCRAACNWPVCNCDPKANEIKQALLDDGWRPEADTQCSAGSEAATKALRIAADEIRGMGMAAARINLFGALHEAYGAAEVTARQLAEKIEKGEEVEDCNGIKHSFGGSPEMDDEEYSCPACGDKTRSVIQCAIECRARNEAAAVIREAFDRLDDIVSSDPRGRYGRLARTAKEILSGHLRDEPQEALNRDDVALVVLDELTGATGLADDWLCPQDDEAARDLCLDIADTILALSRPEHCAPTPSAPDALAPAQQPRE
jgi:hypothetical protein